MDKVSKYLLPTLYVGIIGVMILCVTLVVSGVRSYLVEMPKYNYTVEDVFTSDILPVTKTDNNTIIKPYLSESVKVGRSFYDEKSSVEKQKSSIIYYENTYFQNNGVDYVDDEDFDVLSILDGEVIGIEDNEIYGKILTIKHNDNLISRYCNIKNVLIGVGYKVTQGEIIASSTKSKIDNNNQSSLHFEVYFKEKPIDPETLYTMNVSELN